MFASSAVLLLRRWRSARCDDGAIDGAKVFGFRLGLARGLAGVQLIVTEYCFRSGLEVDPPVPSILPTTLEVPRKGMSASSLVTWTSVVLKLVNGFSTSTSIHEIESAFPFSGSRSNVRHVS